MNNMSNLHTEDTAEAPQEERSVERRVGRRWKYTRHSRARASKWVWQNHWVTKFDDQQFCSIGINGGRAVGWKVDSPKAAREAVECALGEPPNGCKLSDGTGRSGRGEWSGRDSPCDVRSSAGLGEALAAGAGSAARAKDAAPPRSASPRAKDAAALGCASDGGEPTAKPTGRASAKD